MKTIIKILICLTVLSCKTKKEDKGVVRENPKNKNLLLNNTIVDSQKYIDDAMFKVYLKMCARPVLYYDMNEHSYKLNDSLLYGMLDITLISCDTLQNGLAVNFSFNQGSNTFYISSVNLPQVKEYVSGVFYIANKLENYTFLKDNIIYDIPFRIDTALVIRFYNTNKHINPWFKKKLETVPWSTKSY